MGQVRGAHAGTAYFAETSTGDIRLSIGVAQYQSMAFIGRRDSLAGCTLTSIVGAAQSSTPVGAVVFEREAADAKFGTWRLADGAEGVIELVPAPKAADRDTTQAPTQTSAPPGIWNKTIPLGAITLYRDDLLKLIAEIESHVPTPRTTTIRGREFGHDVANLADVYLARKDLPRILTDITINCEQSAVPGFKKILSLTLSDEASSQLFVSSPDELWTEAAAARVPAFLKQYMSPLTGWARRHGLNINFIVLLGVLVWMPDHSLGERLLALAFAVGVILAIARSHRLIPYTRVYLEPDQQKYPFAREIPAIFGALVAAAVTFLVSSAPRIFEFVVTHLSAMSIVR
jgi:hypothetical protein